MTKIDDGGAAFPIPAYVDQPGSYGAYPGMSLRDYFAAQALPALIRRCVSQEDWLRTPPFAYEIADAMLTARKSGGGK